MQRPLVLHQITAMDVAPLEFVRLAAGAGSDRVSVFTNCPDVILPGQTAKLAFPTITQAEKADMLAIMADTGIGVAGVEYFPIVPGLDVSQFVPGLALGEEFGAKRIVCHVHDTEEARAVEGLGRLCELASAHGLTVGVEFCMMTPGCRTLDDAVRLAKQVGRSDFGIGIDCLHLIRCGAGPEDVAALDPAMIANAQICDGHGLHASENYMDEVHARELPGKGDFPIKAILDAIPGAMPIEVEVPSSQYRAQGVSAEQHIRNAIEASRAVVDTLEPWR
ncbi:MAG: sugar phosphate isomerase/epimerase [Novosphingobium sp.]|nr:sugar phosphate isomerase/epimerase [Novosphingobium sp.]